MKEQLSLDTICENMRRRGDLETYLTWEEQAVQNWMDMAFNSKNQAREGMLNYTRGYINAKYNKYKTKTI